MSDASQLEDASIAGADGPKKVERSIPSAGKVSATAVFQLKRPRFVQHRKTRLTDRLRLVAFSSLDTEKEWIRHCFQCERRCEAREANAGPKSAREQADTHFGSIHGLVRARIGAIA